MVDIKIKRLIVIFCILNIILVIIPTTITIEESKNTLKEIKTIGTFENIKLKTLDQIESLKHIEKISNESGMTIIKFAQSLNLGNYIFSNVIDMEIEGEKDNLIIFIIKLQESPMIGVQRLVWQNLGNCNLQFQIIGANYEN